MTAPPPLEAKALYVSCDQSRLHFDTTTELEELDDVLGQPRALEALHFGTGISSDGFNIYALGTPGTGKFETVKQILEQQAAKRELPPDWCYVYNFKQPHKPNALQLPAGHAVKFRDDMEQLIDDLSAAIPAAFETEEYHSRIEELERQLSERRDGALGELADEAARNNIRFLHTPAGFAFAPLDEKGEVIRPDAFERLPAGEKRGIEHTVDTLQKKLQKIIHQFPIWQKETREKVKQLEQEIARYAVEHLIADIKARHGDLPEVQEYLDDVEKDIVDNVRDFRPEANPQASLLGGSSQPQGLARYKVNVLVDHGGENAAPVVYQDLPNYANLVGRVEYRAQMGMLLTDLTLIKAGDLHRSNGGYLILDAERVLVQPLAWDGLKRALRSREIRIEPLEKAFGFMSTVSLEPEPIPLEVKVVLIGERWLYYLLSYHDPEFADLFKVAADFDEHMDRDGEVETGFARLLGTIAARNRLLPLKRHAVARVIEHSARVAGDSAKLSIQLRGLSDLLHEADYWARRAERAHVTRDDVQRAIDARVFRVDRIRSHVYELIERGTLKIDTDGAKAGQINALSVIDLGDFSFGQPSRVTATARLGSGELVDIQRETELGGNVHSKGVLILSHYLASRYATNHPLSVAASLVFEQSYGLVEGDSASLAELCALLSALGQLPIEQSLAVTGSVNQLGEVQAIGSVNEKIEGYFDICKARGLTGNQAVLIPQANTRHLMLRHDVVEAAAAGKFAVYAVSSVDEAMELLTGLAAGERDKDGVFPAESVNRRVEEALISLAMRRHEFAKSEEGDEED
jgi:predicted ATP-dependent protease